MPGTTLGQGDQRTRLATGSVVARQRSRKIRQHRRARSDASACGRTGALNEAFNRIQAMSPPYRAQSEPHHCQRHDTVQLQALGVPIGMRWDVHWPPRADTVATEMRARQADSTARDASAAARDRRAACSSEHAVAGGLGRSRPRVSPVVPRRLSGRRLGDETPISVSAAAGRAAHPTQILTFGQLGDACNAPARGTCQVIAPHILSDDGAGRPDTRAGQP